MKTYPIVKEFYQHKYKLLTQISFAFIYAGLLTIFCMALATFFINKATADIKYKTAITDVRYINTRHNN